MGERKVLNRYFPPDFDPLLVPRRKWDPYKQVEVRMMIPFSLQCLKCGEYMYRGKKFNSRKEDIQDDMYLGIRKYRFYIKCCVCSNEIAFKTDPKNQDYVCESGASRNFESWKQQSDKEATLEDDRKKESEESVMAALESRTLDSKIEMDILDALDEIKAYNERHGKVDHAEVLERARGAAPGTDSKLSANELSELEAFKHAQRGDDGTASVSAKPAFASGFAAGFAPSSDSDDSANAAAAQPTASSSSVAMAPPLPRPSTTTSSAQPSSELGAAIIAARKRPAATHAAPTIKRKLARVVDKPTPTQPPAAAAAAKPSGALGLCSYSTSGSD